MKKWFKENKKSLIVALITFCAVLVSQSVLKQGFDNLILPYLSIVANNSWLVQVPLVGLICLIYVYSCIKSSSLYNGSKIISSRIIWIILLLSIFIYLRLTYQSDYIFYGIKSLRISYTDICAIFVFLVELILVVSRIVNKIAKKSNDNQSETIQSFTPDIPASKDRMKRINHLEGLLNKILASYNSGVTKKQSFTILLNEKYGAGKTTFMLNLKGQIKSNDAYVIDFKPWLCPDSQQMATELLNQFVENDIPVKERLFTKYAQALTNESSWVGVASRFVLSSTSTSLSKHFDDIAEDMQSLKKPIIVLVDDVDRLSEDELIELIKLIRNTAAFPNVFYIVAADKGYLSSTLENKGIKEPEIFLQKFFNFEMTFPKDDFCLEEILKEKLMQVVNDQDVVINFLTTIGVRDVLQTPRDAYRFCNMLSFEVDILQQSNVINEINMMDLMRLTLLRYYSDEIYKFLRDQDDRILDINHNDIVLKDDFKDVIYTHDKTITELAAKITNSPVKKVRCSTYNDALESSMPTKGKIILDLLYDLFPDSPKYNQYAISKVGEYFKYFSGRNAKYEIMGLEVQRIINLPVNAFKLAFDKICIDNKFDNFQDKLLRYLRNQDTNNINIFKNLVYVWQYIKSLPENKDFSNDELFSIDMLSLSFECFCLKSRVVDDNEISNIKSQLDEWFKTEEDLEYLALALHHLISIPNSQIRIILSNNEIREYSNMVFRRFIDEQMSKAPFSERIVKQYYSFGFSLWQAHLQEFIKSLSQQEKGEWIRRVVYKDQNNKWHWNLKLIKGINAHHGTSLDSYFFELGIQFDSQLQTALNKVNIDFLVERQMDNDFVKYIIELNERYEK